MEEEDEEEEDEEKEDEDEERNEKKRRSDKKTWEKKKMREAILMCYLSEQNDANNDSSKSRANERAPKTGWGSRISGLKK